MRVVVIGGGVLGCASALELARRGAEVVLLERAVPGAEASSAAAGVLGAQIEGHERELLELLLPARAGYAAWADELREETGIDVGYRKCGVLKVGHDPADEAELAELVASQKALGLHATLLGGDEARRLEPELSPEVVAAAHFPDDAQVDPPSLLRALSVAVARSRVVLRTGTTVDRVIVEGGVCRGAFVSGEAVRADATVLAAGSWSSLVPGLGGVFPEVRPARGQMILLEERPPRLRSIVFGPRGYVVPRGDGRVLCGSTLEMVGFRREVTAGGIHSILESALADVPSLAKAEVASTWSNFRPFADKPLIGKSRLPGLFLATGHHRNGILLAKLTAERVAEAIFAS